MTQALNSVRSFFKFSERSTTFKKEIIGGLSTFLAMAYILAVNPGMLSGANGAHNYTGVFFLGTAISAMVATMAMGLFANVPVALAPGMGVNAFFTYTVAGSIMNMQVEQALIATFISGILYAIVAVTPARKWIAKMLPKNLKLAIGAMIGLFLAYIGLCDSGILVNGATQFGHFKNPDLTPSTGLYDPSNSFDYVGIKSNNFGATTGKVLGVATATKLGNFADPFVIIALITLALVFVLHFLKVKGAAIIAMAAAVAMVAIAYAAKVQDAHNAFHIQNYSDFGKFGTLSKGMWNSFGSSFTNGKFYIAVFVFLYVDFFDTTGTLFAIGEQANLNKDQKEADKWMKKANIVDAGGTIFGSVMLTSTVTSYAESTVGVSQGARTGFSSVFTGLMFGLAIALWPILSPIMPIQHFQSGVVSQTGSVMPVTGPILILVGALMISQLKHFDWKQAIDIPVLFVTLVFGMLSYSISTGIAAGVLIYYLVNTAALIATTWNKRRGRTWTPNDEEIPTSDNLNKVQNENPDFKARVMNPVIIVLAMLAVAYFATMPLYAY